MEVHVYYHILTLGDFPFSFGFLLGGRQDCDELHTSDAASISSLVTDDEWEW